METKRKILQELFSTGQINLQRSQLFDTPPTPPTETINFDYVEGMMLGLAIGDALGNTSESLLPHVRRSRYGEIRDYLRNRGVPSDDSQMAFWTLEQINEDGEFLPDKLAQRFSQRQIFGIGHSVKEFLRNYKAGQPWYRAGSSSAGNGALMRIAPIIIPHLHSATPDLWVDTALCAMMTHNDSGSTAACLAFIQMIWQLLQMQTTPDRQWWLDTYGQTAQLLETNHNYQPRGGNCRNYQGPLWRFVVEQVTIADKENLTIAEAGMNWYSGAYLLETLPNVIYILMRYGHDPEEAIIRAVNDTKDNDTIAAIVGAAVGALHGKASLPQRWLDNLSGRTGRDDDGKMFGLLAEARVMWG